MNGIVRELELRFLILSALKKQKTKMTIDELKDVLPVNSYMGIQDVPDAIYELDSYGIIDVEYKEGYRWCHTLSDGKAIINVSI